MDTAFTSGVSTMGTVHVVVPSFCNSELISIERKIIPSTQIGLAFIQLKNEYGHLERETFYRLGIYAYTRPLGLTRCALCNAHIFPLYSLQSQNVHLGGSKQNSSKSPFWHPVQRAPRKSALGFAAKHVAPDLPQSMSSAL